ncbi:hypothetical protein E5720_16370 [Rhodococcus sp. PAMC28707]|uniref:hypothetical protein n=1 Tax=unclassified Rhodococcus (in: high G+C Gram-positive bacteria) TaxID=192944 RepID=UPI00109DD28C|nr:MULTISPECIES: hypothetical protein [unclassified Rhodococcus (in: high G+C Gram-positive bacteria)]QCB51996.1 hypothetical protein E5769_19150 [Rhodococcus sp. PAMC28705]QCB61115.1 hypothetical protein E5720_16370 [Rhodococcus sp. PAMC28707]
MALFDKALLASNKLVDVRVERLYDRHPNATADQLVKKLETTFLSSVTAAGAATGGAAAVPGAGTAAALAMTAGDVSWFMTAAAGHILSVLKVHGVVITDLEHQKAIVLTVLAGGGGSTFAGKAASRTGSHLGALLTKNVPMTTIRSINRVLGVNFVTKYGTRQGILVLGRAAPFGIGAAIGAGGNLFFGQGIVKATRKAADVARTL